MLLPFPSAASAFVTPFGLLPAAVVAVVIVSLATALALTALRRDGE